VWLFAEFFLGVKGRREERSKVVFCFILFLNLIDRNWQID